MIAWQASTSRPLRASGVGMCGERACLGERRLGGRHHQRVAVVGPEMHDLARGDQAHEFGLAAEGSDREAASDRLG